MNEYDRIREIEAEIRAAGDAFYLDQTGRYDELVKELESLNRLYRKVEPPPPAPVARWYHRAWHRIGRALGFAAATPLDEYREFLKTNPPPGNGKI
jgi:hypothetical protein